MKDPMKSVPFVPITIPAGGASQSPLDQLSIDWHRDAFSFYLLDYISLSGIHHAVIWNN